MKYQERALRITVALTIAGLVAGQIPMRSQVALGSVRPPSDGYLNTDDDNSGSFLGIRGLTNRNIITGVALGLLGLGVYSTIQDGRAVAATGASGAGAGGANGLKDAIQAGANNKPIYDVLMSMPNDFSETVKLIDAAELVGLLREDTSYTFFAPINTAANLIPNQLRSSENRDKLVRFIKRHTIQGRYTVSKLLKLKNGTQLRTLSGENAIINNRDGELRINNVIIIQNDITASNGFIHPIQAPLGEE
jgi:uncharacterized surface protein with fasciclin (FAS1) repeats